MCDASDSRCDDGYGRGYLKGFVNRGFGNSRFFGGPFGGCDLNVWVYHFPLREFTE